MSARLQQIVRSRTGSLVLVLGSCFVLNYRSWLRAAAIVLIKRLHRDKSIENAQEAIPIAQVIAPENGDEASSRQETSVQKTAFNAGREDDSTVDHVQSDETNQVEPQIGPVKSRSRILCLGADGAERLLASLRAQRAKNADVEILLTGTGQKFYAHSCVLEATSPELAEATRRARESSSIDRKRIVVEMSLGSDGDLSPEALELVLDWGYGALITLNETNVEPLLELASKLKISRLVDECCAFVAQRTTPRTACRVLAIADKHSCTLLRRDVLLCVLRHFRQSAGLMSQADDDDDMDQDTLLLLSHDDEKNKNNNASNLKDHHHNINGVETTPTKKKKSHSSSKSSLMQRRTPSKTKIIIPEETTGDEVRAEARRGFLSLPRHLLDEILSDDRLFADGGESIVFRAAIAWLEAKEARRTDVTQVDAVLSQVRFYLIDAEFLYRVVEPHALMQSPACQELVHAAYRYQALGKPVPSLCLLTTEACTDPNSVTAQAAPPSTPRPDPFASSWDQRGPRLVDKSEKPSPALSASTTVVHKQRHAVVVNDIVDGAPMLMSPRRSSAENPFLPVENRPHTKGSEDDDDAHRAAAAPHRVAALHRCERNDTNETDPQNTAFV